MSAPHTFASTDQAVAVGRESTQGVPAAPTVALPVASFTPADQFGWGDDLSVVASMAAVVGRGQGPAWSTFTAAGPWLADSGPHLLNSLLGDLTTTGLAAPYTHAMSVLNTVPGHPPSLTLADRQGVPAGTGVRLWPGCCLEQLTIRAGASVDEVTFEARGSGWPSMIAPVGAIPAPAGEMPLAGWRLVLTVAGVVVPCDRLTVMLRRPVEVVHTSSGSQAPHVIVRGELHVTGSVLFPAVVDEAMLRPLLTNSTPAVLAELSNGADGADLRTLRLGMATTGWDTSVLARDQPEVGYEVAFTAIGDPTNAGASGGLSPIAATVVNAVPAGTY